MITFAEDAKGIVWEAEGDVDDDVKDASAPDVEEVTDENDGGGAEEES